MGNVTEKDGGLSEDTGDGESMYDTLARDITYNKCVEPDVTLLANTDSRGRGVHKSVFWKSVQGSLSMRRSGKETKPGPFSLSDLEVQVQGKVVK